MVHNVEGGVAAADHGDAYDLEFGIGVHVADGEARSLTIHIAAVALEEERIPGLEAGVRIPQLVQPVDIMPTLLELADVPVPGHVQGQSLLPLMLGHGQAIRPVAVTSPGLTDNTSRMGCTAITDAEWTLQYRCPDWPSELHHTAQDPAQLQNVIAQYPAEARRLHALYLDLLRGTGTAENRLSMVSTPPA